MRATRVCGQPTTSGRCQRVVTGGGGCGVTHNAQTTRVPAATAKSAPSGPPAAAAPPPKAKSEEQLEAEALQAEYEAETSERPYLDYDETNTNNIWQDDRNQEREDRYSFSSQLERDRDNW